MVTMSDISNDETARIHASIEAAEARAQAYIAFVSVPESDHYALYPIVWGALVALIAAGVIALFWPALGPVKIVMGEGILFIAVSLVLEWPPLKLLVVPGHVKRAHACAFAHREFAARILASPERRGGVLLFVSLGERYAELIADREAHARVGQEAWDRIFGEFTATAQGGHVADAAVTAIEACGAALASHPPR
jgi:putative membrane protein